MNKYYKKKRSIHGRRKALPGHLVETPDGRRWVVVDWKRAGSSGRYRCVPLTRNYRRYGPARWFPAEDLTRTGGKSKKAAVQSYRANEWLTENMGRTCDCQCCIHVEYDHKDFSRATGKWINPS